MSGGRKIPAARPRDAAASRKPGLSGKDAPGGMAAGGKRKGGPQSGTGQSGGKVASKAAGDGAVVFPYPADGLLEKGLTLLGFPETDSAYRTAGTLRGAVSVIPLVNRYIRELELFNAIFDLVGADTGSGQGRSDLVVRHILDSLAPWKEIAGIVAEFPACGAEADAAASGGIAAATPAASTGATAAGSARAPGTVEIADAGSGAGFPGIPLAIVFPDLHFTLVERMSKRCAFLENCVAVLGLKNVTVLNAEVEKAPAGVFDIVAFRAFRPLDRQMAGTLLRLLKRGGDGRPAGRLAAWKARREKIETEMNAIADLLDGWKMIPTPVPFLGHEERHLVVTSSARLPSQPS